MRRQTTVTNDATAGASTAMPDAPGRPGRARFAIVVPTIGRPGLQRLLDSLARQRADALDTPVELVIVDDRPPARDGAEPPPLDIETTASPRTWNVRVVRSYGRGPAAARNRGWRAARSATRDHPVEWIAFLDDDVEAPHGWLQVLVDDLAGADERVGGVQGRIRVPLPERRRPTDWERNTAGLESAAWATADMAYRLATLEQVDGFDERFPRAYREDADLALRVRHAGWRLRRGERTIVHPVREADDLVSLRVQAGNADDALMRRLHGAGWRHEAEAGRGAFGRHVVTVAALGAGVALLAGSVAAGARGRGMTARRVGLLGALGVCAWAAETAGFAVRRMRGGPRSGDDGFAAEVRRMAFTSIAIPAAAVWHRLRGTWRYRLETLWRPMPRAVLFDRDGTLVHDVPYNGDPALVRPVDGAREAVQRVRDAHLAVGVVTNQSGIARGRIDRAQADAVNAEIDARLGPFDTWQVCPHGPDDACACRKPRPGMVLDAARALGVAPERCVVVGDIGADIEAACAVGARAVLVPTAATRPDEIDAAPELAADLAEAVDLVLAWADPERGRS